MTSVDGRTEGTTLTAEAVAPAEPEVRRETWRVFRLADRIEARDLDIWHELSEMSGEGPYGYKPQPQEIGEKYGAGAYMLVAAGDGVYPWASFVTVVAETVYREAEKDAVES